MKKTIKKLFFTCVTACACLSWQSYANFDSWHFDASLLEDKETVRMRLSEEFGKHYEEVSIPLENGTTIPGIFIKRNNARATIICVPRTHPNSKESFAPFVKLFPDDCNLLCIDTRNHTGTFNLSLHMMTGKYGKIEHLDVMYASKFIAEKTNRLPQVIFGWGTGATFGAKAIIAIQEANIMNQLNIQGLIFDSGFNSMYDASDSFFKHMNSVFQDVIGIEEEAKKVKKEKETSLLDRFGGWILKTTAEASEMLSSASTWMFKKAKNIPLIGDMIKYMLDPEDNLYNYADKITIPVLVIHNIKNDKYSKWPKLQPFVEKLQNKTVWKIVHEKSKNSHALNHLEEPEQYHTKIKQFINKVVKSKPQTKNKKKKTLGKQPHKPQNNKKTKNTTSSLPHKSNPKNVFFMPTKTQKIRNKKQNRSPHHDSYNSPNSYGRGPTHKSSGPHNYNNFPENNSWLPDFEFENHGHEHEINKTTKANSKQIFKHKKERVQQNNYRYEDPDMIDKSVSKIKKMRREQKKIYLNPVPIRIKRYQSVKLPKIRKKIPVSSTAEPIMSSQPNTEQGSSLPGVLTGIAGSMAKNYALSSLFGPIGPVIGQIVGALF